MSIREYYHNDFKHMNIDPFETRKKTARLGATFVEEEKTSTFLNARDLNYLIQLGSSPKFHEIVEN